MEHFLADPKVLIERDGRVVAVIGLHIDDSRATPGGDLAQVPNEGCGNALPSMARAYGEVIDVHLAPCPLEPVELIGHKTPGDLLARHRHEGNDGFLRQ